MTVEIARGYNFAEIITKGDQDYVYTWDYIRNELNERQVIEIGEKEKHLIKLSTTKCWKTPSKLTPFLDIDGLPYDFENIDNNYERINKISGRIARLLNETMYFIDEKYNAVCINFILNTYFKDIFDYAPRIILTGSTVSGKTRLQNIMGELCYRGLPTIRPTFSSLFRLMDRYRITPIIDETQRLSGNSKNDLEDIFLSGDQKNRPITRVNPNTLDPESFNIFSPMIISKKAGGYTAEDIENRAFTIRMLENK